MRVSLIRTLDLTHPELSSSTLKGLLRVSYGDKGKVVLEDQRVTDEGGLLETVFEDGELLITTTLSEIRERLKSQR